MRRLATGLLVLMALVFLTAHHYERSVPQLGFVRAFAEAAVVGALADWFAVTALFRHPLGLPIPHTAIIPNKRAKIVESIVTMVERDWLSPDVIGARLTGLSPSDLVADWLADPAPVERLAP